MDDSDPDQEMTNTEESEEVEVIAEPSDEEELISELIMDIEFSEPPITEDIVAQYSKGKPSIAEVFEGETDTKPWEELHPTDEV